MHTLMHTLKPRGAWSKQRQTKKSGKEYRQPPCRKHTPMTGVDLDMGMGRGMWNQVQQSPSVLLSLLEKHLVPNGFHRLRFKGQVHHFLPSFSFYHPFFPPASTLFSPSFLYISNCPQNPIPDVLSCCRIFYTETHTATHSHCNIAHPRGRGTGP